MYDNFRKEEENSPAIQVPVAQAPVAQASVAQAPVAQLPVAQVPVAQVPVAQVPVNQVIQDPTCRRLPDGNICRRDAQCCSGVCSFGNCQATRR
jgi:hypothetical protein